MVAAHGTVGSDPDSGDATAGGSRRWVVLGVLCLALLVVGIDGTIVNVALPSLVRELGATSTELQWIVDAYTIIFASFLLIAGSTGDRFGRKRCFVAGMVVFGGGSLACALVASPGGLIAFRAVQGFGAALIMPATLSILTNVFRDDAERARAISIWAGVSGLGVAIGPLAGGYLLEHFWWGAIFLVNVPIVVVAVVAALVLVPESRDANIGKLDVLGTALSTVGLVGLLFGIIEGPNQGWSSPLVIGAFVIAAVLLTAFGFWERSIDHPILDLSFFKNARFSAASIAVTLVFFAMFGSLFFVSQYLQFVLDYSALKSGAALLPVAASLMVSALLSAVLVGRLGSKVIVTTGLVLVAAALYWCSFLTVSSGYGIIAGVLVLIGIGMGLAMAPATDSIMGSLPPEKAGVGSAVNDTTREIGGALGVAILGSITTATYASKIAANPDFAAAQQASPKLAAAVQDSVGAASLVAEHLPPAIAAKLTEVANAAFVSAIDRAVIVGALVALGGALVALLFLPARARGSESLEALAEETSTRLPKDPARRLDLARSALELLADAGMSSLTYNAVAARSGFATATLEHHWTSRVDAVADALAEVMAALPIPDTGDLAADLRAYLRSISALLADERSRQILRALVSEGGADPALADAVDERVLEPRRHELEARLEAESERLIAPVDQVAELLISPLYARALLPGPPPDDTLVEAVMGSLLAEVSGNSSD